MNKNIINTLALLTEWSIILFLIYLNQKFENYWLMFFSVLAIGTRIHALGILMHEASHFNLFTNPKWNDWIAKLFITGPVFISLDSYRKTHQLHHQYSLTEKDPTHTRKSDVSIYNFPKKNSLSFIIELLQILCGYGVYLAISDLIRNRKNGPKPQTHHLIRFLKGMGFVCFLLLLNKFHYLNIYLIYWVLPCLTILPLLNYWRTISEHSAVSTAEPTRTVIYGQLLKWLLTPYNINYHLEHHLYPKKNWYKLTNLKKEEIEKLQVGTITLGFKQLWKELVL